jgi:hypothetical protein
MIRAPNRSSQVGGASVRSKYNPGNANLPIGTVKYSKKRHSGEWRSQGQTVNKAENTSEHIAPALKAAAWRVARLGALR